MRAGARQFWASFLLTLGVLMPMIWCSFLWYDHSRAAAPAAQPQSGVPITAGSRETMNILLAVAPGGGVAEPHLALVALDCPGNSITVCVLPGDVSLLTPGGSAITLAESYRTAGPARAAQLLAETLEIPQPYYLAATAAGWENLLGHGARVDTTRLLDDARRDKLGLESAVAELTVSRAVTLAEAVTPARQRDGLEEIIWDAFARQCREGLASLPDAIRAQSSTLLCSLSAADLLRLDKALAHLATAEVAVETALIPGSRAGSRYMLNGESLTFAAALPG